MKNKISIGLLMVWLLQCSLPLILLELGRYKLHLENFKSDRRHRTGECRFVFSNSRRVAWEKAGKEFKFDGGIYDVISIKDSAGLMVINAYADKKEDALFASYHGQNRSGNDKQVPITRKLIENKYIPAHHLIWPVIESGRQDYFNEKSLQFLTQFVIDVPSPPPDCKA